MAYQVMHYQLSISCESDIGLIRQNNEDSTKILPEDRFFALADGMGGHQAGEVASREAVERLCNLFKYSQDSFQRTIDLAALTLKENIQTVNLEIYEMGKGSSGWRGMGTTLCSLYFHPEGLLYGHVGDSRIYRLRKGRLEQLTQDHSLLQELIELGQLSEQQAEDFLYKNIITKAIGTEPHVEPSVAYTTIDVNDILLMCTDGLTDMVKDKEIEEIIKEHSIQQAANLLIERAKEYGGHDNITLILVKVIDINAKNLP